MEEWKDIDGFPGYQVGSNGQVRSFFERNHDSSRWSISDEPQRILSPSSDGKYLGVNLSKGGKPRHFKIHRLVADAFLGNQPPDTEICHGDGDCHNNRADNLRYDTHSSNIADAIRQGKFNGMLPEHVRTIRRLRHNGASLKLLARLFNTTKTTVSSVCRGVWYQDIDGPITIAPPQLCANKITYEDAEEIRRLRNEGYLLREIAEMFGLSESTISRIASYKLWKTNQSTSFS